MLSRTTQDWSSLGKSHRCLQALEGRSWSLPDLQALLDNLGIGKSLDCAAAEREILFSFRVFTSPPRFKVS